MQQVARRVSGSHQFVPAAAIRQPVALCSLRDRKPEYVGICHRSAGQRRNCSSDGLRSNPATRWPGRSATGQPEYVGRVIDRRVMVATAPATGCGATLPVRL